VESNVPVQVARCSLVIPVIEDKIEYDTIDTRIVTSSKTSEVSHADCGYMIASYFFSSNESLKFFNISSGYS